MSNSNNARSMPPPDDRLPDRFHVLVDTDAATGDWDEAVAEFLLRCVRRKRAGSVSFERREVGAVDRAHQRRESR